jgi:hypothetical protein
MPISFDTTVQNGRPDKYRIDARYRNDRNLVISGVHSDDAGVYVCRFAVPADGSIRVKSVNLIINGKLWFLCNLLVLSCRWWR